MQIQYHTRADLVKKLLKILLVGSMLLSGPAFAEGNSSAPIHIEADRMISQEQKNSVVFIGNVDAKQGDITIRADEMTVYYTEDKNKKKGHGRSSEVKKLICKKNVEI